MKRITGSLVVCVGAGLFTAGALLFGPGDQPPAPTATPSAAASANTATLQIDNFKFASITVKGGAVVSIANRDDATHTVTADKGAFNVKANGKSTASLRAPSAPGTYTFFCAIHPQMHGTLTVK
jgi:plastocyanin